MGYLLKSITALTILAATTTAATAHDTWVQTNTNIVRTGDTVHVDLMLGNHGNDHRDFKLAGKTTLDGVTLDTLRPDGSKEDLRRSLADLGYTDKDGYWSAPFAATKPGLYMIAHTSDKVVTYAPKRSVKSGKAYFIASDSLDKVPLDQPGFDRVMGHALELVPLKNPVMPMGPGIVLPVQLLYKGKPVPGARVSFIPRGAKLSESFDERYERTTDEQGIAKFEFKEGNYYLIAAHHEDAADKGEGYDATKYSATLSVLVPGLCPCCAE